MRFPSRTRWGLTNLRYAKRIVVELVASLIEQVSQPIVALAAPRVYLDVFARPHVEVAQLDVQARVLEAFGLLRRLPCAIARQGSVEAKERHATAVLRVLCFVWWCGGWEGEKEGGDDESAEPLAIT